MKLGLFGSYPPPYGGVSVLIKQCSGIWVSQGHEVHVFNFAAGGRTRTVGGVFIHDVAARRTVSQGGASVVSGLSPRHVKRFFSLLAQNFSPRACMSYLAVLRRIEDICKKYGIEILHSHHLSQFRSAIACACSMDLGMPFVASGYGEAWQYRGDERMVNRMKRVANSAAHVTATSEHCKRGILESLGLSPERVSVIYAGIDTKRYNPKVNAVWLKKKYGIGDERVILFVGRLHPGKGPQYAVRAASLVFKQVKDVRLLVVGPDYWGHKRELEILASQLGVSDKVIFTGEVDEKDLPAHYSLADVLVFPSTAITECMGMTLKQAMAAGIPVIGAKIGGVPEAIVDGETGCLVRPNNEEELAEKILELLKDEKLRREMGLKGRERALKLFRKEAMADKLLDLYNDVLGFK